MLALDHIQTNPALYPPTHPPTRAGPQPPHPGLPRGRGPQLLCFLPHEEPEACVAGEATSFHLTLSLRKSQKKPWLWTRPGKEGKEKRNKPAQQSGNQHSASTRIHTLGLTASSTLPPLPGLHLLSHLAPCPRATDTCPHARRPSVAQPGLLVAGSGQTHMCRAADAEWDAFPTPCSEPGSLWDLGKLLPN